MAAAVTVAAVGVAADAVHIVVVVFVLFCCWCCCCCAAAVVLLLLCVLLLQQLLQLLQYSEVYELMICAMYRFIWSVDVSRPNTTRRQVGLASFSAIHHMSVYSRSQYEKGEDISIHPTRVYV